MFNTSAHLVSLYYLAQTTAESNLPGWAVALMIVSVAMALAFAWAFGQLRATQRRLAQLIVEHESTTATHRELLERERKQSKTLDEKRTEITALKRDLAGQKKKNHTIQQELKEGRSTAKSLQEELQKAKTQRAAFVERPAAEKKPETPVEPTVQPQATKEVPQEVVEESKVDDATEIRIAELERELEARSEDLSKEKQSLRNSRSDLKKMRKRVESFRRVDMVSTGKVEVLEDRLRTMGRQYYEVVSELAALKGEVQPPRPRELETTPIALEEEDSATAQIDHEHSPEPEVRTDSTEPRELSPQDSESTDRSEGDQVEDTLSDEDTESQELAPAPENAPVEDSAEVPPVAEKEINSRSTEPNERSA